MSDKRSKWWAVLPALIAAVGAVTVALIQTGVLGGNDAPKPDARPLAEPSIPPDTERAYLAAIDAYNQGNEEAYYRTFASEMECFYRARNADIRARRKGSRTRLDVRSEDLHFVRMEGLSRVVFCDRGTYTEPGARRTAHNKTIVMEKRGGAWLVTVETTGGPHSCFPAQC